MSNYRKKYEQLLSSIPEHSVFHDIWWLDAVAINGKWQVAFLKENGIIKDAIPFYLEKKLMFRLLRPFLITPYLPNVNFKATIQLSQLIDRLPQVSELIIVGYPGIAYHTEMFKSKLRITTRPTYILDITPDIEAIIANYKRSLKSTIKSKAKKYKIVEDILDINQLKLHHESAFKDKNAKYPYTTDFLNHIIRKSQENNAGVAATCMFEEREVAYIWCVYDRETMYYLIGAYNDTANANGAMELLIHHMIKKAKTMKLKHFDFEGSSDTGIASFFSKFGSEKKEYYVLKRTNSLLWRIKNYLRQ